MDFKGNYIEKLKVVFFAKPEFHSNALLFQNKLTFRLLSQMVARMPNISNKPFKISIERITQFVDDVYINFIIDLKGIQGSQGEKFSASLSKTIILCSIIHYFTVYSPPFHCVHVRS